MEIDIHLFSFSQQTSLFLSSFPCSCPECVCLPAGTPRGFFDIINTRNVCTSKYRISTIQGRPLIRIWALVCVIMWVCTICFLFQQSVQRQEKEKWDVTAKLESNSSTMHRRFPRRAYLSTQPVQNFNEHLSAEIISLSCYHITMSQKMCLFRSIWNSRNAAASVVNHIMNF